MPDGFGLHHVEFVMGMAVSIDLRDPASSPGAIGEVIKWLHHVDRTFSTYDLNSPISKLGLGEQTLSEMSDEVHEVLRLCEVFREETDGIFDPFSVLAPNGSHLDPSGLVKGWSVERAADLLESNGGTNFSVNAGGDVVIRGEASRGTPWRIGVRHPYVSEALALVIEASGPLAIATSATYERGAHIIDPRIGEPTTELASATVVGPDLTVADVYATTLFVMGLDGLKWIEDRNGYSAYVVTYDDETFWTPQFNEFRLNAAVGA